MTFLSEKKAKKKKKTKLIQNILESGFFAFIF